MSVIPLKKLKHYYNQIKYIKIKNNIRNIQKTDFLLFSHDSHRSLNLNNTAYSPLLDSLRDEILEKGYTSLSIAKPWSKKVGLLGYGSPIDLNLAFLVVRIFDKLLSRTTLEPSVYFYQLILKKSQPRVVITLNHPKALVKAARSLNILHAELLHGIGYTTVKWGWNERIREELPQCILSLDPVSTQTFSSLENKGVIIKQIAHPFLKKFQKHNINKIPKEWRVSSSSSSSINYKKEILVSLQWGYAPNIDELETFKGTLNNGLFYEELEEAIEETKDSIFWRFRLHPVQLTQPEKYKNIIDFMNIFVEKHPNCDWKESTFVPLPSILNKCTGHITMSSMSSYEAAYFGVPTLALAPTLQAGNIYHNLFEDLVKHEYLVKELVSIETILDWVKVVEKRKPFLSSVFEDSEDIIEWLLLQSKQIMETGAD